jgi:hypothetical protein
MRHIRFSIASLLVVVLFVAVGFAALARVIHEFLSWSTQSLYPQSLVVDLTQTMTQLNSNRSLGTAGTYDASDNCRE